MHAAKPVFWFIWLTSVLALLGGCASQPGPAMSATWHCDPVLDAQVDHQEWEKALAGHERLLASEPGNCLAMYHSGYIWGHIGERDKEIQLYEQALACGYRDDDRLYFNMGMAYGDLGDLGRASEAFKKASAIAPGNADNYFGLGLIALAAENQPQAEQAWLHAVKIDPRHWDSHLALARLYLDQSRWDAARPHIDAVRQGEPDNEEVDEVEEILKTREAIQYAR